MPELEDKLSARQEAVNYLDEHLSEKDKWYLLGIRDSRHMLSMMGRKDVCPEGWVAPIHMTIGMNLRNQLRNAGFAEGALGVDNLDDHYEAFLNEVLDRLIVSGGGEVYWKYVSTPST